jgi:hypothetical protein
MACSALVESGLWSKDAIERQISHQVHNDVRDNLYPQSLTSRCSYSNDSMVADYLCLSKKS